MYTTWRTPKKIQLYTSFKCLFMAYFRRKYAVIFSGVLFKRLQFVTRSKLLHDLDKCLEDPQKFFSFPPLSRANLWRNYAFLSKKSRKKFSQKNSTYLPLRMTAFSKVQHFFWDTLYMLYSNIDKL